MSREVVAIIDFGSQYGQLIAHRVREHKVYSQIYQPTVKIEKLAQLDTFSVIMLGNYLKKVEPHKKIINFFGSSYAGFVFVVFVRSLRCVTPSFFTFRPFGTLKFLFCCVKRCVLNLRAKCFDQISMQKMRPAI